MKIGKEHGVQFDDRFVWRRDELTWVVAYPGMIVEIVIDDPDGFGWLGLPDAAEAVAAVETPAAER